MYSALPHLSLLLLRLRSGQRSSSRVGVLLCVAAALSIASPAPAQQRDTAALRLADGERWNTDFATHSVPLHQILSGGPPRDGIPALDAPRFESAAAAAEWLSDREPVMVVEHQGVARGYPLSILVWHEIANDTVGGLPVAVTFCPLCNTALVFDRRLDDRVLDFGVTGRLRYSDLVMYDRQTESWWQQATGEAIVGSLTGRKLRRVASSTLAWETARRLHPGIQVLSRNTGHRRPYGTTPYVAYDDLRKGPIARFFPGKADRRLPPMERVVAVEGEEGWAVPLSRLRRVGAVNGRVEGVPVVVLWRPGAASALDQRRVAEGRDVGQTAVFQRRVAGRELTFRAVSGGFRDRETGSGWTLAGRAVDGPMRGQRLQPVPHGNHFWFAWIAFRPQTRVWTP